MSVDRSPEGAAAAARERTAAGDYNPAHDAFVFFYLNRRDPAFALEAATAYYAWRAEVEGE